MHTTIRKLTSLALVAGFHLVNLPTAIAGPTSKLGEACFKDMSTPLYMDANSDKPSSYPVFCNGTSPAGSPLECSLHIVHDKTPAYPLCMTFFDDSKAAPGPEVPAKVTEGDHPVILGRWVPSSQIWSFLDCNADEWVS